MATSPPTPSSPPGRRRTAWHPLFLRILRAVLPGPACDVLGEYVLGAQPQRIDVLVVRKALDAPPPSLLRPLCAHLGEHTLIEFKGPTALLERDDLLGLLGYAAQYAVDRQVYERHRLHLMVVAGRLSGPFRELALHHGAHITPLSRGVHRLAGLSHPLYVIETEEAEDLVLRLFSPAFLRDPAALFSLMGDEERVIFGHVFGEVEQFRRDAGARLRYADYQEFVMSMQEFVELALKVATPQERLRGLSADDLLPHLSPEERLRGLSPEDRARSFSEDDILKLSPEERARLRELLSH